MLYNNSSRAKTNLTPRVCLVSGMRGNCTHLDCVAGKSVAQAQPAKATTNGGMMASHVSKSEHNQFRQSSLLMRREGRRSGLL